MKKLNEYFYMPDKWISYSSQTFAAIQFPEF